MQILHQSSGESFACSTPVNHPASRPYGWMEALLLARDARSSRIGFDGDERQSFGMAWHGMAWQSSSTLHKPPFV